MSQALVFIATSWGSRHGGVNSINTDLCRAFASILSQDYEILCVVLDAASAENSSLREEEGLEVVRLKGSRHHDSFEAFRAHEVRDVVLERAGGIKWWFGHDLVTGEVALEARRLAGEGLVGLFHHSNYFAYSTLKHRRGSVAVRRFQEQATLFSRADKVFAIGPKLAESALAALKGNPEKVVELIPGLAELQPIPSPSTFTAITFGRLGRDDDPIKQGRLSVAAFARAIAKDPDLFGPDPSLLIIGTPKDELEEAQESCLRLANSYAARVLNVVVHPYIENRAELLGMLAGSSVCLMLSSHEGFGLAGWEAISAQVPLILSKNSGVFQFIDVRFGGLGIGCLTGIDVRGSMGEEAFADADVESVAEALRAVRINQPRAKRNAERLDELLRKTCTWRNMALALARTCGVRTEVRESGGTEPYVRDLERGNIEEIGRREQHFEQVWSQLSDQSRKQRYLVLFGGISSSLCNGDAAIRYSTWLIQNPGAQLYICYEAGEAAQVRAAALDESALTESEGLPTNPSERMAQKEKKVLALRDRLAALVSEAVLSRFHLIPLNRPLTNYVMINDSAIYVSPVLQRRSSETISLKLPRNDSLLKNQIFGYMLFQTSFIDDCAAISRLRLSLEEELGGVQ